VILTTALDCRRFDCEREDGNEGFDFVLCEIGGQMDVDGVAARQVVAELLLTRKSMPVCPTHARLLPTPTHPEGGRSSSIGAKRKPRLRRLCET
jgi:hypothetical protein